MLRGFADTALFEEISLDAIEALPVHAGYNHWAELRGARPYPAREELRPQAIKALLRHFVLIKVIDRARDFHMSIVGDEVQRAYDVQLNNRLLSDILKNAPAVMPGWMERYRKVALGGEPLFYRVTAMVDDCEANFIYREVAVLPLGANGIITHVATFGHHELKPPQENAPKR